MATEVNGPSSGEVSIAELEALTNELADAVKVYKEVGPAADADLKYRRKIASSALSILNATRVAEELWNDQSVLMAELSAIRCFMKWEVFERIPFSGSISYKELAEKVGAEEPVIRRMAWVMVSTGFLKQIGEDQVAHTRLSKVYTNKHPSGILFQIMFDEAMIPYVRWPAYFAKHGLKEPKDQGVNPHSFAYDQEGAGFWEIVAAEPKRMTDFMQSMNTLEQLLPITGFYDFSWLEAKSKEDSESPVLVDVGGGKGQALKAILKAYPGIDIKRCYLQDRPDVIEYAKKENGDALQGVNYEAQDFFKPQLVKGAYAYYIRRCMHDYSDENCAIILRHLGEALHPDGRILITEQIMSNPPSQLSAQTDVCMLNIGGKERSAADFEHLAEMAGLKVVKISKSDATDVGVVECVKA